MAIPGLAGPGGVPKFWAPEGVSADPFTQVLRAPTFVPTWRPPFLATGFSFVDFMTGQGAAPVAPPFSQEDWPNPRGPEYPRDLRSWLLGTTALNFPPPPDTTHILRAPVSTPRWQPYRIENAGFVLGVPLTLKPVVAVAAPFSQDDWPNPRGAWQERSFVNWTDWYSIQVIPFTSQGGSWPNPPWPKYRVDLLTWTQSPAVPAAAVAVNEPRAPVYTPRWSPYRIETLGFMQGTTLTLRPPGIVINPPIRLYDWPNPRGWPRPHVGFVTGETLKQPPPPTRTSDCLLLLEDSSGNVILEDFLGLLALELCGPFVTYDLSLPPRSLGPRQDWIQNAYAARNAVVVVTKPFLQTEWPNPRGPVSAHYGFGLGTNLGVLRPDVNPFRPVDWRNPIGLPGLHVGFVRFAQVTPPVVVTTPVAPFDWPNPRGPVSAHFGFALGTSLTVLRPDVRPFAQDDWPNPRAAARGPADYVAGTNLGVLRPDVNPEINYDWPNPQAARRAVADWIQSAFIALQTAPPPPQPFAQIDWQNPRGAFGVHVGWTAATQLRLLRPDVNPFIPRDFANPKAPQRAVDLYGWIQSLSALNLPVPVKPPISQWDWPNPRAPQRGISLGTSNPNRVIGVPGEIPPPPVEVLQPGGRGVPHTFSRKRWRELQMLIAAEMAAVAKAEELTKRGKREALLQAARAAAAAVDAAEAEGENKRLDKLLVRNALTLRAAIRAASEVKLLRETASAIEQSRAIVQRQQDEEDEMINLLMLS